MFDLRDSEICEAFLFYKDMYIKVTTEDFIKKAIETHGDKYSYLKTAYSKAIEKVVITCPTHGDFNQTPNSHLNGRGCPKCGYLNKKKWTKDDFINEVKNRYEDTLPYEIIGEYTGTQNNILIKNNYGICSIRASHLLNGVIAGIETAIDKTKYWINKAKEIHLDRYDYSLVEYINSRIKISIICNEHGIFNQTPSSHINGRGCPICKNEFIGKQKNLEYSKTFKDKANNIHNNKYLYKGDVFKSKENVLIICPLHGEFMQIADNHLRGDGCPKCGLELLSKRMKESPTGWSYRNWEKAGEKSKNFDSFKVYIIKCWNEEEEFYKIGKTFKKVRDRFKCKKALPYNFEIVKEISNEDGKYICELEQTLKICNKENSYIPIVKFNGMYECFKQLDLTCFEEYKIEITNNYANTTT